MRIHIVQYICEQCGSAQANEAGIHSDGMCPTCGSPMRIEDLFVDRRIVTLPVDEERREHAA
jgi:transcription initiation factor IIE alpha subunit